MTMQSLYKTSEGERAVMALYDTALSRWPVPYETRTIPTRHGDTFVIACGSETAPPLVLLHGAGTNSAIWAGDIMEYSRDYRVYMVDLLGEAGKSAPNRPAWDSPAFAVWLDNVLNGLRIDKTVLAGISQGAWTALKYAVYKPERVEKLALLTPGGVVPDKMSFLLKAIGLSLLGKWGARRMVHMIYGSQPIPDGVEDIITIVTSNFKPRVGVLPIFTDEELRRLTMPTLLIGGNQDALRDLTKIAARLRQFLPRLEVTIIPGAGHALMNTTGRVMAFLKTGERVIA